MSVRIFGAFMALTIATSLSLGSAQAFIERHESEVPFLFEHKLIFVEAKINGKGLFKMMLDTGSDISVINLPLARELGLPVGSKGHSVEGAGTDHALFYKTKLTQVEIGDLLVKDLYAGAIDLSKIGQALHTTLDGVLGYNFLQGKVVQIDYPKRVLHFYSGAPLPASGQQQNTTQRTVLPFRQPEYGPVLDEVYINGRRIRAAMDTGSGDVLKLTPEAIKNLGLEKEASEGELVKGMGYNGEVQNRRGKVRSLRVGIISLDEPTVTFFAKGPLPGAIGNGFLQDYIVTIDYRSRVIVFERP
jgi:predicted aspartyl protease